MRLVCFFAFAIVILSNGAMGEYCFQNRVARGRQGSCTVLIQSGTTKAECCIARGTGWTTKSNGKKCEETCDGQLPESEEEEDIPAPAPDPPAQDDVRNCFRTRQGRGILGSCDDLIGRKTKDQCCRSGGKGWTEKPSGKRCQNTCDEVVDDGPMGHCFSDSRQQKKRLRCFGSLGAMTKLECCQQAGVGWTQHENGIECEESCEQHSVTVDGQWSAWGNWRSCSVSCGQGVQRRSRICDNPPPTNGGANCAGETTEPALCDEGLCIIDGRWSEWSNWQLCSVSCGQGVQRRSRSCDNPPPKNGGANCAGETTEQELCDEGPCPIDGRWSEWSNYQSCSVSCGQGVQSRSRTCDNPPPSNGGANCVGQTTREALCDEGLCPIHGSWGSWRRAGSCSATCQSESTRVYRERHRRCDSPAPLRNGRYCEGSNVLRIRCKSLPFCAIHGGWSNYGPWSECSQTCETGIQIRDRRCDNPRPQHGGNNCSGEVRQEKECKSSRRCPIHGGWSRWSTWTECSAKRCGVDGNRLRTRTCTNPSPRLGGLYCTGSVIERESCSVCPHWSEWSVWLPCTDGCEQGSVQNRYRKCLGIGRCEGDEYMQSKSCSELDPCPDAGDEAGSGSGFGFGSGMRESDIPCDDEEGCMPTGFSYSIDEGPSDPCVEDNFDYSIDYDDKCGNGPKDPDDSDLPPVAPPVVPQGGSSYSYDDSEENEEEPELVAPDESFSVEYDDSVVPVEPAGAVEPSISYN